jgi:hypothetical protein
MHEKMLASEDRTASVKQSSETPSEAGKPGCTGKPIQTSIDTDAF